MQRTGQDKLPRETVIDLLSAHDWFRTLSQEELDRLASSAQTAYFEPGETLFEEGDRGEHCFILHRGAIRVLHSLRDGRRMAIARLGPGNIVGELALLDGERRSATVQAAEPTLAVVLAGQDVMPILRGDAEVALSVAVSLARRLRERNDRLLEHALGSVAGGVAGTLLAQVEARQAQGAGDSDVEVVGSAADIAKLAGAPRDSATRFMHWLENEGVVTMKRGKTRVHDPAALRKYLT